MGNNEGERSCRWPLDRRFSPSSPPSPLLFCVSFSLCLSNVYFLDGDSLIFTFPQCLLWATRGDISEGEEMEGTWSQMSSHYALLLFSLSVWLLIVFSFPSLSPLFSSVVFPSIRMSGWGDEGSAVCCLFLKIKEKQIVVVIVLIIAGYFIYQKNNSQAASTNKHAANVQI